MGKKKEKVALLTAYNVKTKQKNCPIQDAVITRTARGAYIANGHDGKGNRLTSLLTKEPALQAIKDGVAKNGFDDSHNTTTKGELLQDVLICENAIYRAFDFLTAMGVFTSGTNESRIVENYLIQARVRILQVKDERQKLLDSNRELLEVLQELVYRKDDKQFGKALLRAMGIFNANGIKR